MATDAVAKERQAYHPLAERTDPTCGRINAHQIYMREMLGEENFSSKDALIALAPLRDLYSRRKPGSGPAAFAATNFVPHALPLLFSLSGGKCPSAILGMGLSPSILPNMMERYPHSSWIHDQEAITNIPDFGSAKNIGVDAKHITAYPLKSKNSVKPSAASGSDGSFFRSGARHDWTLTNWATARRLSPLLISKCRRSSNVTFRKEEFSPARPTRRSRWR